MFTNPNLNMEGGFPIPDRRDKFSNSIDDRGWDTQILMSLESLLLMGVLILSPLDLVDEVDKLFDMAYILMENHVQLVAYKLKRRAAT